MKGKEEKNVQADVTASAKVLGQESKLRQLKTKTLMLGKIEGKRRRGWHRIRWLDSIADSIDMNLGKLWEIVKDRGI